MAPRNKQPAGKKDRKRKYVQQVLEAVRLKLLELKTEQIKSLCAEYSIDPTTVRRWMNKDQWPPHSNNLFDVAKYFGITAGQLVGSEPYVPEEVIKENAVPAVDDQLPSDGASPSCLHIDGVANRKRRTFKIEGPPESFTQAKILMIIAYFKQFAEGDPDTVQTMKVQIGSLIITFEMTTEQSRNVTLAMESGAFLKRGLLVTEKTESEASETGIAASLPQINHNNEPGIEKLGKLADKTTGELVSRGQIAIDARVLMDLRLGYAWGPLDLARKANCPLGVVHRAEKGERIERSEVEKIALALGVSPLDITDARSATATQAEDADTLHPPAEG